MVWIIRCLSSKWTAILNNRFSYSVVDILSDVEMTNSSITVERILIWREKSTPKLPSDLKNVTIDMNRVILKKSLHCSKKCWNVVYFIHYVLFLDKCCVFWLHRDLLAETVSLTQQQLLSPPDCDGRDCGRRNTIWNVCSRKTCSKWCVPVAAYVAFFHFINRINYVFSYILTNGINLYYST